jgi:hypothetical protein
MGWAAAEVEGVIRPVGLEEHRQIAIKVRFSPVVKRKRSCRGSDKNFLLVLT